MKQAGAKGRKKTAGMCVFRNHDPVTRDNLDIVVKAFMEGLFSLCNTVQAKEGCS